MRAEVPLLRQRDFAALWWGQLISLLGERFTYLALVGLLSSHTSNFGDPHASGLLSVLANVMVAPVLLLAPFTGAWVDRWNLKRVLIGSDLARALLVGLIPVLYDATGQVLPVFVMVFLLFTCNVFFLPAKSAITPELVAPSRLLSANALLVTAGIIATAVGTLAAGWLIDRWGVGVALWINAVTYLISVVALSLITYHPERHAALERRMSWRDATREIAEGWKIVRHNRTVGLALVTLGAVWAGGGFLHVAGNQHVLTAARTPGMERIGVLLCTLGLGSGVGAWWVNTRGRSAPRGLLLGGGLMLVAAGLVVFALATRFAVFCGAAFVIGLAAAPSFLLSETLIQEGTEARQRGRVFSVRDFLMRLVFIVAASIAGWSGGRFGLTVTLIECAVIVAIAGGIALSWGRLRRAPGTA